MERYLKGRIKMNIKDLKGLKYPDLAIIKFFFKNALYKNNGKVLEYGCSNGSNLSLFAGYDYKCIGVDLNKNYLEDALFNFSQIYHASKFQFFEEDIVDFAKNHTRIKADVFLIPNVINYLPRKAFIKLLENAKKYEIYKENAYFFIRTRSIKDYRFGLGEKIEHNSFKMLENTTGEKGALNTFYQEYELVQYLKEYLNLYDFKVLSYESTNIMGEDERLVNDSDIVIYGKIK